jgi:sugar lactone lactonase YvrE
MAEAESIALVCQASRCRFAAIILGLFLARSSLAQHSNQPQLIDELQLSFQTSAIATTPGGRTFLNVLRLDGSPGSRVVEWVKGKAIPYPNALWNEGASTRNASSQLVLVNSLRIGPEGDLWLVDSGTPAFGQPKLPHGPKLIEIDVLTDQVKRVFDLDPYTKATSFVDDVRFHGNTAYLTDARSGAIIVLDLSRGNGRRTLEQSSSVRALTPMMADGRPIVGPDGKPLYINSDQLEVSPDGRWLYFQPASGPLSRIETKWLDPSVPESLIPGHVEPFANTPSTGGTAIDVSGNIYVSDTNKRRLLRITPDGAMTELLADERLSWVDATWIDNHGY